MHNHIRCCEFDNIGAMLLAALDHGRPDHEHKLMGIIAHGSFDKRRFKGRHHRPQQNRNDKKDQAHFQQSEAAPERMRWEKRSSLTPKGLESAMMMGGAEIHAALMVWLRLTSFQCR